MDDTALRALFIGAHMDECEYGTGGLARLLHDSGVRTRFFHLQTCDPSVTPEERERIYDLSRRAAALLGAEKIPESSGQPVWVSSEAHVARILREILEFRPHLVFLHFPRDTHPEHREVAKASFEAVCLAPAYGWHPGEIYAFEAGPDQTVQYFTPDFVIDVTDQMDLLDRCYHVFGAELGDQLLEEKRTGAAYRGLKSGFDFGEAYKIVKFPDGGNDLTLRVLLGERFRWFGNEYYPAYGELYF